MTGTWYRVVPPQYHQSALNTRRTKAIRSRFSPGSYGTPPFEILYLCENRTVALYEVEAQFKDSNGNVISNPIKPLLSMDVRVCLQQVADLTEISQQRRLSTNAQELTGGGDTADTPGYSLNLVRIPVSVMPGKHSKKGYGAEIAITATPHLGPELLPLAYRDFVINDLVDQLSVPITRYLNNDRFRVNRLMTDFENIELQFETTNQRWQSARATSLFTRSDVKELLSRLTSDQQNKFAKFRNTDGSPTPENITIDNVDTFLTPIDRLLTIALEEDLNQINVVQSIATTNDATDDDSQKKLEASKREIQDVLRRPTAFEF